MSADATPIIDDTLAAVVDSSDNIQTHTMSAVVTTEQRAPDQVSADTTPIVDDTLAAVVDNSDSMQTHTMSAAVTTEQKASD